ncbi:hypothetical protein DPMN_091462 [Dreissena polymorpha]|uniref:Uncharacterized protein n=1 Tax=Dreissena polymorpha TaxID=45954 RepID=A0A9D4QZZ8_DREPO|nr:hypothetical protein DPMN_091462 [Dreissena polymorpha]
MNNIMEGMLQMLTRDVVDQCKQSVQYFFVLSQYVQMVGARSQNTNFLASFWEDLA